MKKSKTITQYQKDISRNLLDSIWLLETLYTLNDGEAKMGTIINIINGKIRSAFNDITKCRKMTEINN